MMMDCTAILFDLDGVLVDSRACVERHWRSWAAKHGLDADEILAHAHGIRNVDTMQALIPHLDVEQEAANFAAAEVADTAGVVAMDGALALLSSLDHVAWAIVTSCGSALARARLATARLPPPPVLVTGSDVTRGKPEPEPFILAANRLAVPPEQCVVIEDAPSGVVAGKRAAMRVMAVAFTYDRGSLLASGADFVADRLDDFKVELLDGGRARVTARARPGTPGT